MTATPLDADQILDTAAKEIGLEEFADSGIRHRFALLVESFNDTGALADWQRPQALAQLSQLCRTRLELSRDEALYPEIMEERIEQPFFVVGSGRTGTTLMQVLLALGDGCRTPRSWECRHPSPPPGLEPASEPKRIAAEQDHIEDLINLAPGLLLSHPYIDQGAYMEVEDEDIFALDFHTAFPWHFTRVPVAPMVHHKAENTLGDSLKFHKRVLQHLQWKTPTQHWVCKSAQHYFQLPMTWEVYPDAKCVWTHRDPVIFLSSLLGILEHFYLPHSGIRLHGRPAEEVVAGLQMGYQGVLDSDWIDDDRVIHIRFDDFAHDPIGAIHQIYERAGMSVSPGYEARMRCWLDDPANRSDRHGRFRYSLEQFGLDPDDIRDRFASYYQRFLGGA